MKQVDRHKFIRKHCWLCGVPIIFGNEGFTGYTWRNQIMSGEGSPFIIWEEGTKKWQWTRLGNANAPKQSSFGFQGCLDCEADLYVSVCRYHPERSWKAKAYTACKTLPPFSVKRRTVRYKRRLDQWFLSCA